MLHFGKSLEEGWKCLDRAVEDDCARNISRRRQKHCVEIFFCLLVRLQKMREMKGGGIFSSTCLCDNRATFSFSSPPYFGVWPKNMLLTPPPPPTYVAFFLPPPRRENFCPWVMRENTGCLSIRYWYFIFIHMACRIVLAVFLNFPLNLFF